MNGFVLFGEIKKLCVVSEKAGPRYRPQPERCFDELLAELFAK